MKRISKWLKNRLVFLLKKTLSLLGSNTYNSQNQYWNDKNVNYNNFCELLKAKNINPKYIIDVGANRGTWTRVFYSHFPKSIFRLFEPQDELQQYCTDLLAKENVYWYAFGVGDTDHIANFSIVDREDSCNFAMSQDDASEAGFEQKSIQVISLNNFLPKLDQSIPDIIKIDAEGWDMEVLNGASNYFGKTEVFFVEVGINNTKAYSALEVMNFMNSKGYRLFDIVELNRPYANKNLWLSEMIFVRKDGQLDNFDYTQ